MSNVSQIYFNKKIDQVTLEDIQKLIENKVTENYTLDYKALTKKPQYGKYGKIISSFLNTNGGLLIIGVSEKDRKYPDNITWGTISRETIVQNLYNVVDPWSSDIRIKPIENPEDNDECVFVIDVPKSKNPPHMADNVYYYRNVFESIPMTHTQVKGVFTESHLAKEKILERVIEPIYVNIRKVLENEKAYEAIYGDSSYSSVKLNEGYLYDQLGSVLRNQIDHFFELVKLRDEAERGLRDIYSDHMKRLVVESLKGAISLDDIINKVDLLEMSYHITRGLKTRNMYPNLFECILHDQTPFFEAEENPIENFKAGIKGYGDLSKEEFLDFFIQLKRKTRESPLFETWKKAINEMESSGSELISLLLEY